MRPLLLLTLTAALLPGCGSYGLTEAGLEGELGARLSIFPAAEVQFPVTPAGGITWSDITLISSGDEPVWIEEIWLEGEGADEFYLPDELPVPAELLPGAEMPLTLRFMPEATGQRRALMTIGTDYKGVVELSRDLIGRACADDDDDGACDDGDTGYW